MISPETRVQIRRYFYAEHWKVGTIAQDLEVHPDTVRRAIEVERFQHAEPLRASILDPYLPFVRQTLDNIRACAPRASTRWFAIAAIPAAWSSCGAWSPACARNRAKPSCDCMPFPASKRKSTGLTSVHVTGGPRHSGRCPAS